MACKAVWFAAVLLACALPARADIQIIKDVTLGFGEALKHCRDESQLTEEKMEEFFYFWHDDFKFDQRELGCAIKCMSNHFNLLTSEHKMHRENADKFIRSFPNGEVLSEKMTQMIHECEQDHDAEADHCWRILRVSECFKNKCKESNLAPSMEVAFAELIMEGE